MNETCYLLAGPIALPFSCAPWLWWMWFGVAVVFIIIWIIAALER